MVRVEVFSAVRGLTAAGRTDQIAAGQRLEQLEGLPPALHPAAPSLPRMWELRHNFTPYDAWYVTLAEAFDAPILMPGWLDRPASAARSGWCDAVRRPLLRAEYRAYLDPFPIDRARSAGGPRGWSRTGGRT